MKPSPYLDIHTHRRTFIADSVSVASLSIDEILQENITGDYATVGIHPWWVEEHTAHTISSLKKHMEKLCQDGKIWALGETGIDRIYPQTLQEQKELFLWHLALAELHALPLVIHNVRSGSDFLEILKNKKPTTPWIFHDFRGNQDLLQRILALHPPSYFSFGISIDNSPQVRELLPLVPLEHLFLETDNQKHLDIHDIYVRTAEQLKVDIEFLKAQIWLNFRKIGPHLLN